MFRMQILMKRRRSFLLIHQKIRTRIIVILTAILYYIFLFMCSVIGKRNILTKIFTLGMAIHWTPDCIFVLVFQEMKQDGLYN